MSRIAKLPIRLPSGVKVTVSPEMVVTLKGPKGEATIDTKRNVSVSQDAAGLLVGRKSDEQQDRAFHGLYYRLLTSAVKGITDGYSETLEMVGVGYKAELRGKDLVLNCGLSHEVLIKPHAGVTITTPNPTTVIVSGPDKQAVGQEAAKIRMTAPPEPYKGKGIRYQGEAVRRKVGKSGAK